MVTQHAFTFLAPLPDDRVAPLRKLLQQLMQDDVEDNQWFPMMKMETIHFARLLILKEKPSERKKAPAYPNYLVFSTNYDGSLDAHLREIVEKSGDGFQAIFGHFLDGPTESFTTKDCVAFLKRHSDYRAYFYIGTWGRSVQQIRHEEKVRQLAEDFLDQQASPEESPRQIWQNMVKYLRQQNVLLEKQAYRCYYFKI
ncbi:MAG: hypothetical protein RIG62_06870 [Cyclobacteriaceae bacterium]